MWILIAAIVLLGCFAALSGYLLKRSKRGITAEEDKMPVQDACCGRHEVCERDSLLSAVSSDIEYYDDYELDDYKNIQVSDYDSEAIDRFEEVFYTLRSEDVAGWVRSLGLRGIELPDSVRDEVLLVIGEKRIRKMQTGS
ncbi:MAG: phospholipase [Bacteroidales bacterium]